MALATVVVLCCAFALAFFYAPNDADQGFVQKIFYLHVPIAICALAGFILAAIYAIAHLRTGNPIHDVRSYVSIHMGIIFGEPPRCSPARHLGSRRLGQVVGLGRSRPWSRS